MPTDLPEAYVKRISGELPHSLGDPGELPDIIGAMDRWLSGVEDVLPYAKIIESWGEEFEDCFKNRRMPSHRMTRVLGIFQLRDRYVRKFGFAIPCAELLDALEDADKVVEIGAGSGFMTRLMRNRGISVVGSDPGIESNEINEQCEANGTAPRWFHAGIFDPQQLHVAGKTMVRRHPDALIFCSWPSLNRTWFRQALRAMRIGQRIIVIREDACAEDTAWSYFGAAFEEQRIIDIPCFEGLHDHAVIAVKKREIKREQWIHGWWNEQ